MYKAISIAAICGVNLLGQTVANPGESSPQKRVVIRMGDVAQLGAVGISGAMAGPAATVAGAPYSAQVVTQRLQILADGNRIEQSTSGSVYRESHGRVRREEALPAFTSDAGEAPRLLFIEDPVAGVHWTLDPQHKTAIKVPLPKTKLALPGPPLPPPPIGPDQTFFLAPVPPAGGSNVQFFTKNLGPDSNVTKADLGKQTMEGLVAEGTRTTRTIPAGAIGNEQPILITTETWYSPDLKVLVLTKTNDPRMGETIYKLTNINRSEPSAQLFQVPNDYAIKEQPTNTFIYTQKSSTEPRP